MYKVKKICMYLAIICFAIAGGRIIYNLSKNGTKNSDYENNKNNYESQIETISKNDKIGVNTNFKIIDIYAKCNHQIEKNIDDFKKYMNMTYNDVQNMYPKYSITEFNKNNVILQKKIDEYCPYHFILRQIDNKIGVYRQINDTETKFVTILDINIDTLRQNDRYMFKNSGVKIYGEKELYQFIEDFDS